MNEICRTGVNNFGLATKAVIGGIAIAVAAGPWAFGQPSATPVAYKVEEPANRGLDATLFMQTSAEYRASCYQAYNLASTRLDELVKARMGLRTNPSAVVMDLDETVFDNSRFQVMLLQNGLAWNKDLWAEWEGKHAGDVTAIAGAKEFIDTATKLGVEVFYVSNRNEEFGKQAKKALAELGIPLRDDDHLQLMDPNDPGGSDKTKRFNQVRSQYDVLLYVGDNLKDFDEDLGFGDIKKVPDGELDDRITARKAKVDGGQVGGKAVRERFGSDWIILPNPTYGEWKAPLGRGQADLNRLTAASFQISPKAKCKMFWGIPFIIFSICLVWTLFHWPKGTDLGSQPAKQTKMREYLVLDIRANSQYCYWYLAFIGVIGAIVAAKHEYFGPILNQAHLWPFGLAFLAASLALLFLPAGYGTARTQNLRLAWLRSVLCEQIVIIFTCYGIWEAFRALTLATH